MAVSKVALTLIQTLIGRNLKFVHYVLMVSKHSPHYVVTTCDLSKSEKISIAQSQTHKQYSVQCSNKDPLTFSLGTSFILPVWKSITFCQDSDSPPLLAAPIDPTASDKFCCEA
ncbi:hypothetical protein SUGI_0320500 [Cryptomeria japonica]|nr:hypothetical protein SUGI_0320500 [Cryptomeria japonica]